MSVLFSVGSRFLTVGKTLTFNGPPSSTLTIVGYPTTSEAGQWIAVTLSFQVNPPTEVSASWSAGGNAATGALSVSPAGSGNYVTVFVQAPNVIGGGNILTVTGTQGNTGSSETQSITITGTVSDGFQPGIYGPANVYYTESATINIPISSYVARTKGPQTWTLSGPDAGKFQLINQSTWSDGYNIYYTSGVTLIAVTAGQQSQANFSLTVTVADAFSTYSINVLVQNNPSTSPTVTVAGNVFLDSAQTPSGVATGYAGIGTLDHNGATGITLTDNSGKSLFTISGGYIVVEISRIPTNFGLYTITLNLSGSITQTIPIYLVHEKPPLLQWIPTGTTYTNSPPLSFSDGTAFFSPGQVFAWDDSGNYDPSITVNPSSILTIRSNGQLLLAAAPPSGQRLVSVQVSDIALANSMNVVLSVQAGVTLPSSNITASFSDALDNSMTDGTVGSISVTGFKNTPTCKIDIENSNLQNLALVQLGFLPGGVNPGGQPPYMSNGNPPTLKPRYILSSDTGSSQVITFDHLSAQTDNIIIRYDDGQGTTCVAIVPLTVNAKQYVGPAITVGDAGSGIGSISGTTLTVSSVTSGTYFNPGQPLTGTGVAAGTAITASSDAIGAGSVSGTTLSISSATSALFVSGQVLRGNKVQPNTIITAQLSGNSGGVGNYRVSISQTVPSTYLTGSGGPGHYTVSISQTVPSTQITAAPTFSTWNAALDAFWTNPGTYAGVYLTLCRRATDYSDDFNRTQIGHGSAQQWAPAPYSYGGPQGTLTPINFNGSAPGGAAQGGLMFQDFDTSISNLEVYGAGNVGGSNGNAGALYKTNQTFGNFTATSVYVHDSENCFINGSPGNVIIFNNCRFGFGGTGEIGLTHNVYVDHVDMLLMTNCQSFSTAQSHEFKVRARRSTVQNCQFIEGVNGRGSTPVDFPSGGVHTFSNNIVTKCPNPNNNGNIINWQSEASGNGLWDSNQLTFESNTILNFAAPGSITSPIWGVTNWSNSNPNTGLVSTADVGSCLFYNLPHASWLIGFGVGVQPPTDMGNNTALATLTSVLGSLTITNPINGQSLAYPPGPAFTDPVQSPTGIGSVPEIMVPALAMLLTCSSGIGTGVAVTNATMTAYDASGFSLINTTWTMPQTANGDFTFSTVGSSVIIKTANSSIADGLYFIQTSVTGTSSITGNPVQINPAFWPIVVGDGQVAAQ